MKKEVFRLVFGTALMIAISAAFAQQNHTSGGGSGGGSTTRSSGPGGVAGGSGMRMQGNPNGGGYGSRTSGSQTSNGGRYGNTNRTTGGYSSRYGGSGSSTSRFQSRNGEGAVGRSEVNSNSRSGGNLLNRSGGYGSYYGPSGTSRTSGYSGRSGAIGNRSVSGSEGGFDRGHADESRSGHVTYNTNSNRNGTAGVTGADKFSAPHRGLIGPSVLGKVIGDSHVGLIRGGWRTGYFGYWGGWRDSFFAFPFYVFDPWVGPCYCSPWYYYPCLPAYIAAPRVIIVDSYPSTNWQGDEYDWAPGGANSSNVVLDDSVQDMIQAFEQDDHKALDRLVPHSGNVNIYTDGKYAYTLSSNDFYDTYVDGIESTKTDRYEIMDVKASKDGASARVTAKHVYNDPWGNRTYVYHSYFLLKEGDEYVIREFGTSDYSSGW